MSPSTRKTISVVCLVFAIAWFVLIGLLETHYVRGVLQHQSMLHDILGTIYEEQIEGINFVVLIVFHRWFPGYRGACSGRSEEHTSELQSQSNLVCRLLLEKKKQN